MVGRLIGYARVSTEDQNLDLQIKALREQGCIRGNIYSDKISGIKSARPGLDTCLKGLKSGDTLLVWRIDRLGRSLSHLVTTISSLRDQGIHFRSLNDGAIDTTTASGEFIFNLFACLAQMERRVIQERTRAGLSAARARGKKGGRPALTSQNPRVRMAKALSCDQSLTVLEICGELGVSRSTYYRLLNTV
ncbi:MAG: recombinase family protein [Sedimenticola sp.]